jgi:hypothetical protein
MYWIIGRRHPLEEHDRGAKTKGAGEHPQPSATANALLIGSDAAKVPVADPKRRWQFRKVRAR